MDYLMINVLINIEHNEKNDQNEENIHKNKEGILK